MATRADHARAIAVACNNYNPNNTIVAALVGWSMNETGGTPRPKNNMLSCGQWEAGSTIFNPPYGVRNYLTIGDEGSAVATNLSDGNNGYAALKAAIAGGYWDSSVEQGLITWVGHDAYGSKWASFVALGQAHLNDDYDTGASSGGSGGTGTTTVNPASTNPGPIDGIIQLIAGIVPPLKSVLDAMAAISKDPLRIVKFIIGLLVLGVGLLMVFVDVIEVVSNSQAGQAIKKTASAAGKAAEMAA